MGAQDYKRRLPTVVDRNQANKVAGQSVVVPSKPAQVPAHRPTLTKAVLDDSNERVVALQRLERAVHDETEAARAHPMHAPHTEKNVSFTSGSVTYINHSFGASVNWLLVGWRSAGVAPGLEESGVTGDQTDNRLALKSYATGTGDVLIWRRP